MKIKQNLSLFFAALLAFSMVACGNTDHSTTDGTNPSNPAGSTATTPNSTTPPVTAKRSYWQITMPLL